MTRNEVTRNNRTIKIALLLAAIIIFIAARLWHFTVPCLWFDELFSIHAARHSFGNLISFVAVDIIHPPLFYLLLKIWIAVGGESILWLRLLPVSFAVAAVLPLLLLCRELKLGFGETALALFLMATNNYLIKYAQTLRMYSLLMFLGLGSLWLFAKFTNTDSSGAPLHRRRILTVWFAVNLLLVYTHYYGWILIALELVYLLLCGKRQAARSLAKWCGALALLFGAWAITLIQAVSGRALEQNLGWAARPRLSHLLAFYATLTGALDFRLSDPIRLAPIGVVLFVFPVLVWMWSEYKQRRASIETGAGANSSQNVLGWLATFAILPVAVAFLLSNYLPQSIWGVRHLVVVAAPSLMLVAAAIFRLPFSWLRNLMLSAIACWIVLTASVVVTRRDGDFVWCTWNSLVRQMQRDALGSNEKVKVYAFEELIAYHLWFALEETEGAGRYEIAAVKGVNGLTEDPAYFLPRGFSDVRIENVSAINEDYFWIAFRDEEWSKFPPPLAPFLERGYRVEKILSLRPSRGQAFLISLRRNY